MNFECGNVGVALHRYAFVRCDIDSWVASSYTLWQSYLTTCVWSEWQNLPFEYLVKFGEYFLRVYDIYKYVCVCVCLHIYMNNSYTFRVIFPLFFTWADTDLLLPNYTAFHRNFPQALHTPLLKPHASIRKKTSVY